MSDHSPRAWLHSPATLRNRDPILDVLRARLADGSRVLEVACGTGEHAVHMAEHLPAVSWHPSDLDPYCLEATAERVSRSGLSNLSPPIALDARAETWPLSSVDAVICINLIHIAPWQVAEGLVQGAARILADGGILYVYGPFEVAGRPTAPSNISFDRMLRRHNPDWGVRRLDALTGIAVACGLTLDEAIDMPANNLSVIYTTSSHPSPEGAPPAR